MTLATVSAAPSQLRQGAAVRGRGWSVLEKLANPPSGGGLAYTIDGTYWRRLMCLAATLTTSAAAGSRQLALNYTDGDGYIFNQCPLIADIGPSSSAVVYADQATVTPISDSASFENEGNQTSPAATTTIATLTIPSGTWQVAWQVSVSGTVGAPEINNFALVQGGTQILASDNGNTAGQLYPQEPVEITVPIGGQTVLIRNTNLATVGAVYSAQLVVTAVNPFAGQAQIPDLVLKSGWTLQLALTGAQAGDQLSGIGMLFERYPSSDIDLPGHHLADELAAVILGVLQGG